MIKTCKNCSHFKTGDLRCSADHYPVFSYRKGYRKCKDHQFIDTMSEAEAFYIIIKDFYNEEYRDKTCEEFVKHLQNTHDISKEMACKITKKIYEKQWSY